MSSDAFHRSRDLARQFKRYISSGGNSPGRLFSEVKTPAIVVREAHGSKLIDVDGNKYIDFVMGLGPNILGHSPQRVMDAVKAQVERGLVYGINSVLELELARRIVEACPQLDELRFTCSGTEAVMTAVRVARAHTNRPNILRFKGGYHGHSDVVLSYGNQDDAGEERPPVIDGIPQVVRSSVLMSTYNDINMLETIVGSRHKNLAAIVVEPVAANMGLIIPDIEFLKALRALSSKHGIVLIFDEVVSGFRMCYGTVSNHLGIEPDLVTFGKIIGGGLPIGAFGGRTEIMKHITDRSSVFQGGTFAGNPLTMAAGLAMLDELGVDGFYENLNGRAREFTRIVKSGFERDRLPLSIQQYGSLASFIFSGEINALTSHQDVQLQDLELFSEFHFEMAKKGVLFATSIEEPIFFSSAHSNEDIEFAANTSVSVLTQLVRNRRMT